MGRPAPRGGEAVRPGVAFLLVCIFGAGIAWLAGYDFNTRGPGVAFCTVFVLLAAVMAEEFARDTRSKP